MCPCSFHIIDDEAKCGLTVIKYLSLMINKITSEDRRGAQEAFDLAKKEFQDWMKHDTSTSTHNTEGESFSVPLQQLCYLRWFIKLIIVFLHAV